ncbi:DUF4998 domain-containing protein [Pedobacter frigoris]|uniref:DUF4998 domain-containing protein n=1 Tax=Pedobacter frigoris TaxID=2571272 RepID=UPI00293013D7|nr:DUF4998 domain-containing protein [Pedobacter frigoris]
MKTNILTSLSLLVCILIFGSSCSKTDDYRKEFQGDKEISYPGILDSAKVLPGNKRAIVRGLFTSDPKIVKYRIYWNGKQNMIEKEIKRSQGVDLVEVLVDNLDEGGINFEIRTFDAKGNISVPINISGVIYGDVYAAGIVNRVFNPSTTLYNATLKRLTIDWQDIDDSAISTLVTYTNLANEVKTVNVTGTKGTSTIIEEYKTGTDVTYRTAYKPKDAIDIFYVNKIETFRR